MNTMITIEEIFATTAWLEKRVAELNKEWDELIERFEKHYKMPKEKLLKKSKIFNEFEKAIVRDYGEGMLDDMDYQCWLAETLIGDR